MVEPDGPEALLREMLADVGVRAARAELARMARAMTVGELIERLKLEDPELMVVLVLGEAEGQAMSVEHIVASHELVIEGELD